MANKKDDYTPAQQPDAVEEERHRSGVEEANDLADDTGDEFEDDDNEDDEIGDEEEEL
jgi:hypothetical protein